MEMKIKKNQLNKLLELYYKEYENVDCKIIIDVFGDIDFYEKDECRVLIKQVRSKKNPR